MPKKESILKNLHLLTSNNVIGDKQLFSRYKGFKAELYFNKWAKEKNIQLYEGGTIISKSSKKSSLIDSIYISTASNLTEECCEIFEFLSKLEFNEMYLILYENSELNLGLRMKFKDKELMYQVPEFKVLKYDLKTRQFNSEIEINKITEGFKPNPNTRTNSSQEIASLEYWLKENLSEFDEQELTHLLINRMVVDGIFGLFLQRGKISDIDFITKKNGTYNLIEVKEKNPARVKKGFGLDIPRIKDFAKIQAMTGIKYHLVIREIKDQITREFKDWKYISINDFIKFTRNGAEFDGGHGMRSVDSHNPTLICKYDHFQKLKS